MRSTRLLPPGAIRQAAQVPSHYLLDDYLSLPKKHRPFMWFSALEGLLVLTRDSTTKTLPLALHFLPGYRFDTQGGILLTNDFPAYPTWIQKPLISQQGLFIATEDQLLYFPTHGYKTIFALQRWQPKNGNKIKAISLNNAGHPLILLRDNNNYLQLLLGNAQSGFTDNTKMIDLDKPADEAGYGIATGQILHEWCAIYDGHELLLVNLKSASLEHKLELKNAIKPARYFLERTDDAYFEPFLIGSARASLQCIIPVLKDSQQFQAGVVRFDDDTTDPLNTQIFRSGTWVLPDPWGVGFIVWSMDTIERYEGHQPAPKADEEVQGGNFSGIEPLQTPHWLVGQAQTDSTYQTTPSTEIFVFSTRQHEDRYYLRSECQPKLSNVEGGKIVGMPPLQSNGRLFIALRETHHEIPHITMAENFSTEVKPRRATISPDGFQDIRVYFENEPFYYGDLDFWDKLAFTMQNNLLVHGNLDIQFKASRENMHLSQGIIRDWSYEGAASNLDKPREDVQKKIYKLGDLVKSMLPEKTEIQKLHSVPIRLELRYPLWPLLVAILTIFGLGGFFWWIIARHSKEYVLEDDMGHQTPIMAGFGQLYPHYLEGHQMFSLRSWAIGFWVSSRFLLKSPHFINSGQNIRLFDPETGDEYNWFLHEVMTPKSVDDDDKYDMDW
jgi:hypothetical protein